MMGLPNYSPKWFIRLETNTLSIKWYLIRCNQLFDCEFSRHKINNNNKCTICNLGKPEDLSHLMFKCPHYSTQIKKFK
jgi:hypothetical protein